MLVNFARTSHYCLFIWVYPLLMIERAAKPTGEIHVKTLEEIRLEKANQRRGELQMKPKTEGLCRAKDPSPVVRPSPAVRIKTFSEVLAEKKNKPSEEEKPKTEGSPTKPRAESEPKKQGFLTPAVPSKGQQEEATSKAKPIGEVRIKTLEEIKQEKALRIQQSGESVLSTPVQPEPAALGKRVLRITKLTGNQNALVFTGVQQLPFIFGIFK